MKSLRIALMGATFLLTAGAANAADVYSRNGLKDEPVYKPWISWTGLYIGGHLGGSFDDSLDWDNRPSVDIDSGLVGGLQLGYNWQLDRGLVFGVEGDIGASGADETSYLGSVRGRVGFTVDKVLIYGTGGVAFLGWDNDDFDTTAGWVAGGGIDYKINQSFSIGLEGLYYSFSDSATVGGADLDYDRDFAVVRARVNYHFGAEREALK